MVPKTNDFRKRIPNAPTALTQKTTLVLFLPPSLFLEADLDEDFAKQSTKGSTTLKV